MDWYQGELTEAISSVKSSKKILLIYVYGKDEDPSKELLSSLEACTELTKDYLCLKLEASSLGAAQLNAFYPVMVVPLIYIINHDGSALESICGRATPEEIRIKLSNVESLKQDEGTVPEPSVTPAVISETAASTSKDATDSTSPGAVGGAETADTSDAPGRSVDLEARQVVVQEQLTEIRRRKMEEEKEKEKQKELERREVGQRLAELKRSQREQELKELREEIAKKRKEERETRDRIRRQIEEDRRERMARNAAAAGASVSTPSAASVAGPSSGGISTPTAGGGSPDGDTRLQFRLPDGSNVVHIFRSSAPLREAFDFITAELNGRFGAFRISSLYPRRLFGPDDMAVSLLDLALTPSAALVVMPDARAGDVGSRGGGGNAASSTGGGSLVEFALMPLLLLWGMLCSIFTALISLVRPRPTPAVGDAAAGGGGRSVRGAVPGNSASNSEATGGGGGSSNAQRDRRVGGINRLSDLPRDDDDVNTWNGNSTEQM